MEEKGLACHECGRPVAVPGSNCPWCGALLCVICAACKQYTDAREPVCQHCGATLQADTLEEVRAVVGLDPQTAQLLVDRRRARLLPSAVIAQYLSDFFFSSGQQRTVLADLLGAPPDAQREAAALLFAAVAYLVMEGYCALRPAAGGAGLEWVETRTWDGQLVSLEAALIRRAGLGLTLREAFKQVVSDEMGFRFEVIRSPRVLAPGMPRPPPVRNLSARSATSGVVALGRHTVLPDHEQSAACRQVYGILVGFVRADPARARQVAGQIVDVLEWFERYEKDPSLVLVG